jgi:hypothetical protein
LKATKLLGGIRSAVNYARIDEMPLSRTEQLVFGTWDISTFITGGQSNFDQKLGELIEDMHSSLNIHCRQTQTPSATGDGQNQITVPVTQQTLNAGEMRTND